MNFRKKSVVVLIGLLFVTSLPASSNKTKQSDSSGVGRFVAVSAGLFAAFCFGRHMLESWKRHHNNETAIKKVDKKVDNVDKKVVAVQGTCHTIAAQQQGLSTQLTHVETKVDGVQKTAETIQQGQKTLSAKADAIKIVVDDNNAKLGVVDTQLKTIDARVVTLSEEEQKRHSENTNRFNQQDLKLSDIHAKIIDKEKTEKFMSITEAHLASIHAMSTEHAVELKSQGELLAQQKIGLAQVNKHAKKIVARCDHNHRRIKAVYKYMREKDESMEPVSDSDDENTAQQQSVKIRAQTLVPSAIASLAMTNAVQKSGIPVA